MEKPDIHAFAEKQYKIIKCKLKSVPFCEIMGKTPEISKLN